MNILVVYDSAYGHTKTLALAITEGVKSHKNTTAKCLAVGDASPDDLDWADGIAIGCPTHMGSMSWQMKKFVDEAFGAQWVRHGLVGKVGAVFTTAGSGGMGGGELTMLTLLSNMAQNGMILVSHPRNTEGYKPDGMAWGPVWSTSDSKAFTAAHESAARAHGARLAHVTSKLLA